MGKMTEDPLRVEGAQVAVRRLKRWQWVAVGLLVSWIPAALLTHYVTELVE